MTSTLADALSWRVYHVHIICQWWLSAGLPTTAAPRRDGPGPVTVTKVKVTGRLPEPRGPVAQTLAWSAAAASAAAGLAAACQPE